MRELGDPPEPNAFEVFDTVETPGKPQDAPAPPQQGNEALPTSATVEPPDEPEPPPVRPVVEYLDVTPIILFLRHPVRIEGVGIIRRLEINSPALWDIQDWAAGRIKTNWELISRMVGVDPVALGALRWPDIETLASIAATLLPDQLRAAIEAIKQQPIG
jgi:hypothetical protein